VWDRNKAICNNQVWWVEPGGTPDAPQSQSISLPSSAGQGGENTTEGSWVETRAGKHHSPITIKGKTDSAWGN